MAAKKRKSGAKAGKRTTAKKGGENKGKAAESAAAADAVPKSEESRGGADEMHKQAVAGVDGAPKSEGDAGVAEGTQERRASATAPAGRKKRKGFSRPGVTYRKEAKVIAVEMAKKAKRGSYLHARELRQMAIEDDSRRKPIRRRSSGVAKVLLARLDQMADEARRAEATAVASGAAT